MTIGACRFVHATRWAFARRETNAILHIRGIDFRSIREVDEIVERWFSTPIVSAID